jgi:hypothetical protein
MGILEEFLSALEDDDEVIDIKNIIQSSADRRRWEKWIELFGSVGPDKLKETLNYISANTKMNHQDQLILLAYVKYMEIQVQKMIGLQEMMEGIDKGGDEDGKHEEYSGAMYG